MIVYCELFGHVFAFQNGAWRVSKAEKLSRFTEREYYQLLNRETAYYALEQISTQRIIDPAITHIEIVKAMCTRFGGTYWGAKTGPWARGTRSPKGSL